MATSLGAASFTRRSKLSFKVLKSALKTAIQATFQTSEFPLFGAWPGFPPTVLHRYSERIVVVTVLKLKAQKCRPVGAGEGGDAVRLAVCQLSRGR
jgi:hypothetical protein